MQIHRCPECGMRLRSNYCDICMRKVPFKGTPAKQTWQHVEGSSAHREEGHACIDFGETKKKTIPNFRFPRKQASAANKKKGAAIGIFLAVMSVIAPLFGLVEEVVDSTPVPEPDYSIQEGFVEAGNLGAEDVPNVIAGEIYNANGIRITADDAGLSYGDYTIFMTIYNDTDQSVSINMDLVSVNGYMLPFGLYQDVEAGESVQTHLTFYDYELEKAGIKQVAEVVFSLDIYEEDSFGYIVQGELVTIETVYDGIAEPAVDISGLELYNDGILWVILRDIRLNEYGECELDLYIENLSGSTVNVYSGDSWVNAEQVQGYYWKALRPDTRAIDDAYLYELDDLNIEELSQIEEITIDLYVDYMDGWDVVETISEKITFEPSAIK